jgi:hypothetical protein
VTPPRASVSDVTHPGYTEAKWKLSNQATAGNAAMSGTCAKLSRLRAIARSALRSGFLTSAAAKGASIFKMMDQSGHKSIDTLRGYVRDAELFKDHAGTGLL